MALSVPVCMAPHRRDIQTVQSIYPARPPRATNPNPAGQTLQTGLYHGSQHRKWKGSATWRGIITTRHFAALLPPESDNKDTEHPTVSFHQADRDTDWLRTSHQAPEHICRSHHIETLIRPDHLLPETYPNSRP